MSKTKYKCQHSLKEKAWVWRDSSVIMVKSIGCLTREPKFSVQYPHDNLQVSGNPILPSGFCWTRHVHGTQTKHPYTLKSKKKNFWKKKSLLHYNPCSMAHQHTQNHPAAYRCWDHSMVEFGHHSPERQTTCIKSLPESIQSGQAFEWQHIM